MFNGYSSTKQWLALQSTYLEFSLCTIISVAESGWSTDGVTTMETAYDEETKTFHVICQSQHLTSFCVLVDVTGEQVS